MKGVYMGYCILNICDAILVFQDVVSQGVKSSLVRILQLYLGRLISLLVVLYFASLWEIRIKHACFIRARHYRGLSILSLLV